MPELDHLIFASPDVDAGIDHIAGLTGVRAEMGGPHPGMGTHNALLTFDDVTYFEIIAIDPAQDPPAGPRPFGLTPDSPMRLAGFAIHPAPGESIDDVVALMRDAGYDPGAVTSMSRVRPDGVELQWRLTVAHRGGDGRGDGVVPFVIDWGTTPSPATTCTSMGRLVGLEVAHPDADVRTVVDALGLGVAVVDGAPGLRADVASPAGAQATIS